MPIDIQTLESIDLFAELKPDELELVQPIAHRINVAEQEVLTRIDAPAGNFFIILSGNFMVSFQKGRAVTLHNTGDIMGWSSVFTPFRYKGMVVALTDGEVLALPGDKLLRLIQSNAALGDKIMRKINQTAAVRMFFAQSADSKEGF